MAVDEDNLRVMAGCGRTMVTFGKERAIVQVGACWHPPLPPAQAVGTGSGEGGGRGFALSCVHVTRAGDILGG